jgi:peptidoglycan/LPS O-acetylase OafA/YrhL
LASFQSQPAPGVAEPREKAKPRRYHNLDILRILLALEVVAFHTAPLWHVGWTMPIDAVSAFLCLSGFLIPGSFGSSRSAGHFAWKRFLRVGPALLVSFALVGLLFGVKEIGPVLLVYLTAGIVGVSMNDALWSLMVEEVLYAQHAVARILRWAWHPVFPAVMLVLTTMAFFYVVQKWPQNPNARILGVATAFFAGNLAYMARASLGRVHWSFYAAAIVLMLVQPAILGQFVLAALPLALVLLAYTLPQFPRGFPDISYGVYIYHLPFLHAWVALMPAVSPAEVVFLTFSSAIAFAGASWYAVESRALQLKDWYPPNRRDIHLWVERLKWRRVIAGGVRVRFVTPANAAMVVGLALIIAASIGRTVVTQQSAAAASPPVATPAVDISRLSKVSGADLYSVDQIEGQDLPKSGSVLQAPAGKPLQVAGWAVDQQAHLPALATFITVDGKTDVPATYGMARPDVAQGFKLGFDAIGFEAFIPPKDLGTGPHQLSLKIVSADGQRYYQPDYTVTVDVR